MNLSVEKTESIYQGQIKYIVVTTDEGLKLQLPATNFKPFVTANGILGRFLVETNEQNRLQRIDRIAPYLPDNNGQHTDNSKSS
jgi:hypothetical protein